MPGPPANSRRVGWNALLALLFVLPASARADKPIDGLIVQVPAAVTTESINRLRSLLHGPLQRFEAGAGKQGGIFRVICDFNPDGQTADSADFGPCYELARYLRRLPGDFKGAQTIAYVHGPVRRHSVLAVLACSEIVFSSRRAARLGPVVTAGHELTRVERTAYDEITANRFPAALVRKLYDPDLVVVRVGDRFHAGDEKPRPRGDVVVDLPEGEAASYTFALARQLGLCQQTAADNLEEVRVAYGLPRGGPARALDRTIAWRIPVEGTIDGALVEQTKRRIRRAIRARASLIVLELACSGGESEKAYELGLYLAELRDQDPPVETIAHVTRKARNTATFLALGCGKIFMQADPAADAPRGEEDPLPREATLGGFERYLEGHPSLADLRADLARARGRDRERLKQRLDNATTALEATLGQNLVDLARRNFYPSVLAAGMFSRPMRIHEVERAAGRSGKAFMTDEEFKADQKGPKRWRSVKLVKPATPADEDHYLTLTARQAADLGIAQTVKDFDELCTLEGLEPARVRKPEADWLDGLADFLRDPWTSVVLVMIGITCLILELKMPGVGLPGVISAICFVLFFWAHSQLNGQITWLAILLFVLGLVLIALEVFVLPGFGVCGVSGILLVLVSLGLVAYGHWPRTSSEWVSFGHKISPFGISMLGSLALVFLVARYLPHIPVLNRLMLKTAEEAGESPAAVDLPGHAELAALLGAIGVAATPLRPAGKTQFGDDFVDVVAEGGYIMPGTRVQVVEVEGNRVVVKEV
jgi:membrane-bound ClpP family serine protease